VKIVTSATSKQVTANRQEGAQLKVSASPEAFTARQSQRITLPNNLPYDVLLIVMKYHFSLTRLAEWQEQYSAVLDENWQRLIYDLRNDAALSEEYLRYYIRQLTPVALWQELLRSPPQQPVREEDSDGIAPVVVVDEEQFYSQSYTRFNHRLRGGPVPDINVNQLVYWYQRIMEDREAALESMLYERPRGFPRRCLVNQEKIIVQARASLENIREYLYRQLPAKNLRSRLESFVKEANKIRSQERYRAVLNLLRSLDPHRNPEFKDQKTRSLNTHQEAQALQECFQFLRQLEQSSGLLAELFIFYNLFQIRDIEADLNLLKERKNYTKLFLSQCFYLNYISYIKVNDFYEDEVFYSALLSNPELVDYLTSDNKDLLLEWMSRLADVDKTLPKIFKNNPKLYSAMTPELWLTICERRAVMNTEIYNHSRILSTFSSGHRYQLINYSIRRMNKYYNKRRKEAQKFLQGMNSKDLIHFIEEEHRHEKNDFSSFIRGELARRSPAFPKLISWLDISYKHTIANFYCNQQALNNLSSQERCDLLIATWDEFCVFYNKESSSAEYFLLGIEGNHLKSILNNEQLASGLVKNCIQARLATYDCSKFHNEESNTHFNITHSARLSNSEEEVSSSLYFLRETSRPSTLERPTPIFPPQEKDFSSRWTPKQKWGVIGIAASLIVGGVLVASGIGLIAGGGVAAALGLTGIVKLLLAYKAFKLMLGALSVLVGVISVGCGLRGGYVLYQSRKKSNTNRVTLFGANNHDPVLQGKNFDKFSSLGFSDSSD